MENKGTVRLESERLILRRFIEEDIEPAFENWTSDSRVTEFLTWQPHKDTSVTRRVIESWMADYARDDFYQWVIEVKQTGEIIGTISVIEIKEEVNEVRIGYCIGSRWWHQGYVSEAFARLIPFLFEQVGAERIQASHDPDNPNSGKVMEKCGLVREGVLRKSIRSNRGITDACVYAILAQDYFKRI